MLDAGTFEAAYADLAPRAHAIAARVTGDPLAAEDVVQEVFTELWRRPDAFDATRGTLSAYVSMLARCRALDRVRAASAHEAAAERSFREAFVRAEPAVSAVEPVLERERSRELLGILRALPKAQRDAIILTCGLGLTTRELADSARVPLGTAKSRLRLGLRRARALLGEAA
jgi:RNA polymerase sigma-70 factor, ECF subfamily